MPDITMCTNMKCPLASECYRARAKPSEEWQAYSCFVFDPTEGCDMFWPMKERDKNAEERAD